MDFRPSPEQQMIADSVRRQLQDELSTLNRGGRLVAEPSTATIKLWKSAIEQGWLGMMVSETDGGLGAGAVGAVLVFEELGRANAPGPFLANAAIVPSIASHCGDEVQRCQLLEDVLSGSRTFGLGLYAQSPDDVVLENQSVASDVMLISASKNDPATFDVRTAVVPRDVLTSASMLDVHADASRVHIAKWDAEFQVPAAALMPLYVAMSAEILGIAAQSLEDTVAYAKDRNQFGRPIGSFQAVKHQLADCYVLIENARTAVYYAALCWDGLKPERFLAVDLARTYCGQVGSQVIQTCIQMHGGFGYTWESGLHVGLRRVHALNAYLGSQSAAALSLDRALISGEIEALI
jgi:alkylation response protein AidB-like acyl-CoA dehydrogenase